MLREYYTTKPFALALFPNTGIFSSRWRRRGGNSIYLPSLLLITTIRNMHDLNCTEPNYITMERSQCIPWMPCMILYPISQEGRHSTWLSVVHICKDVTSHHANNYPDNSIDSFTRCNYKSNRCIRCLYPLRRVPSCTHHSLCTTQPLRITILHGLLPEAARISLCEQMSPPYECNQKNTNTTSSPFKSRVVRLCFPALVETWPAESHQLIPCLGPCATACQQPAPCPHNCGISKQGGNSQKQENAKQEEPSQLPPLLPKVYVRSSGPEAIRNSYTSSCLVPVIIQVQEKKGKCIIFVKATRW